MSAVPTGGVSTNVGALSLLRPNSDSCFDAEADVDQKPVPPPLNSSLELSGSSTVSDCLQWRISAWGSTRV
eukprot:2159211-Prymnesium_polylepis.1